MKVIRNSITAKICLSILLIETTLLGLMGSYYVNRFWQEIDKGVAEKMTRPAVLMTNRALNFDSVADLSVLEEILQEDVVDAFITKVDGRIYYSHDSSRIDHEYKQYVDRAEPVEISGKIRANRFFSYTATDGLDYMSIVSPLETRGRLIGMLYIKILYDKVQKKKNDILFLFLGGSLATIFLTTLVEAFFVHRMFVPPVQSILSVLKKVQEGDFSTRIVQPGLQDQMGTLIDQVNSMIATIERNTVDLILLNRAGDLLGQATTEYEVKRIAKEIVEEFFRRPDLSAEKKNSQVPDLDYSLSDADFVSQIIKIVGDERKPFSGSGAGEFAQAFGELISNAIERVRSVEDIKQAEEKYRSLFTTAVEGIIRSTPDGKVLEANPSMAKLAGYKSPEEMIQLCDNLALQHYENPEDRKFIIGQLKKHGSISDVEFRLRRRDGTVVWGSISAHTVEDRIGRVVSIDGRVIDITERKQREKADLERQIAEASEREKTVVLKVLEEKNNELQKTLKDLKATQKKLVQSEKMVAIGMTVGGVAHDLNNILSGVISYPEMLLMKLPQDSTLKKPLESIMASGKRAAAVVDDLLTLTRGIMQNKVTASVNHLVDEYIRSAELKQLVAGKPDIHIACSLRAESPNIYCSPIHIQKVIMNLMTNAIEALSGSGTVTISTCNCLVGNGGIVVPGLADGRYVQIKVDDNGPGIRQKDINHIFEPFYTKKVMGRSGTGLGLTIVRNAVDEHGGTVRVQSSKEGTSFDVYIPAGKGTIDDQDDSLPTESLQGDGTILVVDDEPLQRDVAKNMLRYLGYSVNTVRSGEEALEYLSEKQVDLLLLDMLMPPGMNGYETFKKIVQKKPGQRAILVSGYSDHEDVKKALEIGVGKFLKKPYSVQNLGKAVRDVLVV